MSDIISKDAAHWRQLCEVAALELNREKQSGRIADARTAVLAQIEGAFPVRSEGERLALSDALDMLLILQDIAKREIVEQRTGT